MMHCIYLYHIIWELQATLHVQEKAIGHHTHNMRETKSSFSVTGLWQTIEVNG